ncbi:extracellular solute-binding protein [Pseudonocardia sp. CA-107938]|uniref:extracellular solute-binding protein n=1 Tax=Pseudonocardia sp. CA-107938 TaxID=3240021 RepID=UPI003D95007A
MQTTRRAALAIALVAGTSILTACGTSAGSSGGSGVTLTFATFGGAYEQAQRKAWLDEFTAQTGITVVTDAADYGKLKTMVQSGDVSWDVVDVQGDYGLEAQSPMLEEIDCTVVTSCATPAPGLTNTKWRVAENTSAMVFGYNTAKTTGAPTGWADFFDTWKFPGKRAFPQWVSGGAIEAALLADGVPAAQLYPLDIERALRKLDTIKSDIVWWETGTQSEELLASGETVFSLTFSPRLYNLAVVTKKPVAAQWNQQITFGNYLVIPKGTRHEAEANKLIAFMTDKSRNGALGTVYPQGPGTAGATANPPAAIADWLPTAHLSTAVNLDDAYWDSAYADADAKFQAWKLR